VITFNYKGGAKTVMLTDIPDNFGSDLDKPLPPLGSHWNRRPNFFGRRFRLS